MPPGTVKVKLGRTVIITLQQHVLALDTTLSRIPRFVSVKVQSHVHTAMVLSTRTRGLHALATRVAAQATTVPMVVRHATRVGPVITLAEVLQPLAVHAVRGYTRTAERMWGAVRAAPGPTRAARRTRGAQDVEPGRILQAVEAQGAHSASRDTTHQAVQTHCAHSARRGSGPGMVQRPVLHSLRFQPTVRSLPDSRHLYYHGTTTHHTRVACGATVSVQTHSRSLRARRRSAWTPQHTEPLPSSHTSRGVPVLVLSSQSRTEDHPLHFRSARSRGTPAVRTRAYSNRLLEIFFIAIGIIKQASNTTMHGSQHPQVRPQTLYLI